MTRIDNVVCLVKVQIETQQVRERFDEPSKATNRLAGNDKAPMLSIDSGADLANSLEGGAVLGSRFGLDIDDAEMGPVVAGHEMVRHDGNRKVVLAIQNGTALEVNLAAGAKKLTGEFQAVGAINLNGIFEGKLSLNIFQILVQKDQTVYVVPELGREFQKGKIFLDLGSQRQAGSEIEVTAISPGAEVLLISVSPVVEEGADNSWEQALTYGKVNESVRRHCKYCSGVYLCALRRWQVRYPQSSECDFVRESDFVRDTGFVRESDSARESGSATESSFVRERSFVIESAAS